MAKSSRLECKLQVLSAMGFPLEEGAAILDFGCGAGDLVQKMRDAGYQAYGCDISFTPGKYVDRLSQQGSLRIVPTDDYRLPFEDDTFDLVSSDQVLEHVQDHDEALREILRVLKPGGVSLNVYPPRLTPIEPHVFVPLASWFRPLWWLRVWAWLGIKNQYQVNKTGGEVALANAEYLSQKTNYAHDRDLRKLAHSKGFTVLSGEKEMLRYHSSLTRKVMRVNTVLPIFPWLCRTFVSRVVLFHKK